MLALSVKQSVKHAPLASCQERVLCSSQIDLSMPNGWPTLNVAPSPISIIPLVNSNAVGKRYRVHSKIGQGSFGTLYLGIDVHTNERVAIKAEQRSTRYPQLMDEYKVYRQLEHCSTVPKVLWSGANSNVNIMVMELLGDSLEKIHVKHGRVFSPKTVCLLAIQLLTCLEQIHGQGYLHRDIKPDNFVVGPPQSSRAHMVYVIDFGLAKRYKDEHTGRHIPNRSGKSLTGTPRYASIRTHQGMEQSCRDDIESIGYILVYLSKGRLPWQNLGGRNKTEKYDKIKAIKLSTSLEQLCSDLPAQYLTLIEYARNLDFEEKPNYQNLKDMFTQLFLDSGFKDDFEYDWTKGGGGDTVKNSSVICPRHAACVSASRILEAELTDTIKEHVATIARQQLEIERLQEENDKLRAIANETIEVPTVTMRVTRSKRGRGAKNDFSERHQQPQEATGDDDHAPKNNNKRSRKRL